MKTLALLILCATCIPVSATSIARKSLEELVAESDHVVVATVAAVQMYDRLGREIANPRARTGPGEGNRIHWTIKIDPEGVLFSSKKEIPEEIDIKLWTMWHSSLESARGRRGKTYIFLLKGDDMQWVYPGWFYRDLREREEILKLIEKKNEPNKAVEPTPVDVTIPAAQEVAPSTSAAHLQR